MSSGGHWNAVTAHHSHFETPCLPLSLKDRPAMQLYQPGARNRKRMSSAGKGYDCIPVGHSPEPASDHCFEVVTLAAGLEKVFEKSKEVQ